MRVTVAPEEGRPLVLHDEDLGHRVGCWLAKDGVEGWYGTPAPREGALQRGYADGDLWPTSLTQGSRVVTLHGIATARSAVELARLTDALGALACVPLSVIVEDAAGWRMARGFLADDPDPRPHPSGQVATFDLIVACPDPRKYGREVAYAPTGGTFVVRNAGNAGSFPRVEVERGTRVSLSLGGALVTCTGFDGALTLDLADMRPSAGTVTVDNAFAVPGGRHEIGVSTDGEATLYLRSAWR